MGRLRNQEGFALPVAMAVLVVILMLAAAASLSAISATDTSNRDVRVKRAVAAAEAGLDAAMFRANALSVDLNNVLDLGQQCVVSTAGVLSLVVPSGGQWCSTVSEDLGTGAGYEYRMSPVTNLLPPLPPVLIGHWDGVLSRKIVATGKANCPGSRCVKRRLYMEVTADAEAEGISLLGLQLLTDLELQLYRRKAGTFRECRPTPPDAGDPASGC